MADDDNEDKWTWRKDDVQWFRVKDPDAKPLLTKEEIKIAKENLRRIAAGEPLLNGSPSQATQGTAAEEDAAEDAKRKWRSPKFRK